MSADHDDAALGGPQEGNVWPFDMINERNLT